MIRKTDIESIDFIPVEESLPETRGSQAFVYMKFASGRISKGMFYMNGRTPVFASYGSQCDGVIAWAYWKHPLPERR